MDDEEKSGPVPTSPTPHHAEVTKQHDCTSQQYEVSRRSVSSEQSSAVSRCDVMNSARTSVSSDGDASEDGTVSVPATPPPLVGPMVSVDSMVVQSGATGVLHGNIASFTVNQYIVNTGDDLNPKTFNVSDLTTDAVKINTEISKTFLPQDHNSCSKLDGKKEDLEGLQRRWCWLIAALVALSFVTLLCTAAFSLISWQSLPPASQTTAPQDSFDSEESLIAEMPGGPRIVTRSSWLAAAPTEPLDTNTLPVTMVVVCHTATEACSTTPDCISKARDVQEYHQETRHWSDIAYNFLVGGDGSVYWARGFDNMGSHTKGYNNGTIGIAFIGTFIHKIPNVNQIEAFQMLIDVGVRAHKISRNYSLVAQCQLQTTAAPGLALVNEMFSWPHFDSSLPLSCTST